MSNQIFTCPKCNGPHFMVSTDRELKCTTYSNGQEGPWGCGWKGQLSPPLSAIGKQLRTQDNRRTANPAFCVQVLERIGPIDTDYSDERMYHDHERCETYYPDAPDPGEWKRLNELDGDFDLPSHITAGGYVEKWITVQTCFTEDGCGRYLSEDGHNLRHYHGTRIYVDSFNRNVEMIEIRESLLANHGSGSAGGDGQARASTRSAGE